MHPAAEPVAAGEGDVVEPQAEPIGADDQCGAPRSIFMLWAAIYVIGFSLYDVDGPAAGIFWVIAGPSGGLLSFWLGRRWAARAGVQSRQTGMRHLLHWGSMTVAVFLAIPLLLVGSIDPTALARVILLIIAFGLFTAGLYLVRAYLWIGLVLAVCYVGVLTISDLPWTVVGVLSGGAMFAAALLSGRASD